MSAQRAKRIHAVAAAIHFPVGLHLIKGIAHQGIL